MQSKNEYKYCLQDTAQLRICKTGRCIITTNFIMQTHCSHNDYKYFHHFTYMQNSMIKMIKATASAYIFRLH